MPQWHVYVGCFTSDLWSYFPRPESDTTIASPGIERLLFDDSTGVLNYVEAAASDLSSPQYIDLHPRLPLLYAAEFARPGRLVSFAIGADGRLTRRATSDTGDDMAVAVNVHPNGSGAYVGHLGDGALTYVALDSGGKPAAAEVLHRGASSADSSQQVATRFGYRGAGPKQHQVRVTPDGRALVVTDVGSDAVVSYVAEEVGGPLRRPVSHVGFPLGAAPRHIEFHPSGNVAFVVGEGDGKLYALEASSHVPLRILRSYSLATSDDEAQYLPSEIHLHPDGRTLFVGVRRANCILVFDVDASGGIELLSRQPSGGKNPRAVRVSPSGKHLLVGNWDSNNVVTFAIDGDRKLTRVGASVEIPSPSSMVFAPTSQ